MSMKLFCLYLVQHLLHRIKAQQFYTDLDLYQQCKVLQKIEEFKDFSRPLSDFPVLFKADLIFKDFSRKPSKFKYFSSLCKPCKSMGIFSDAQGQVTHKSLIQSCPILNPSEILWVSVLPARMKKIK